MQQFFVKKKAGTSDILLFGGQDNNQVFSDLWIYNINSNLWNQIVPEESVQDDQSWPPRSKFSTMTYFSKGLVLIGGTFSKISNFVDVYKSGDELSSLTEELSRSIVIRRYLDFAVR